MRHEYIEEPGPLDPPNRRMMSYLGVDVEEQRWLCSCGATGNWFRTHYLRRRTVDQRQRGHHAKHVQRATA